MKKRKKKKTRNQGKWHAIVDYFKKHIVVIVGVILTAIVSAIVTKACDRIVPDPPAVVEKVPDTISIVHVYEPLTDSALGISHEKFEKIVDDAVRKQVSNRKSNHSINANNVNIISNDFSFPNAEGYSPQNAAPYFWLEMTDISQPYIDFICHFFNDAIIEDIYCLSIKVFEIQKDGRRVYVLDENYCKQKGDNIIRLKNIFSYKNFEIEVGFVFNRDRNSKYPTFYREAKYINNKR